MKLSNIASTVIATLALVAGAAHAEDPVAPVSVNGGTVHFKGELVNAACSVNTDSSEQTVNLGQYRTAKFTKVGDTTSNIPFTIELKGVGIEILDSKSSTLTPDGATFSAAQNLIEGTNTLNFTARYKATTATTAPGQANADATFVMKYE